MPRFSMLAAFGALVCAFVSPLACAAGNDEVIRRAGWSYDRSEFTNSPDEIAVARKNPDKLPLSGWIEFDVPITNAGWYELWIGGMPPGWMRDLIVDGVAIYRSGTSDDADMIQPPPRTGVQFKDTNLYLTAGKHVLRFNRASFSGSLPAVWELRPVAADDATGSVRVVVEGTRVLGTGEKITLIVIAGAAMSADYQITVHDQARETATAGARVTFPALTPGTAPIVKRVEIPLMAPGLYKLSASVNGRALRPSEFKTGLFLATDDVEKFRAEPKPVIAGAFELAAPFRNGAVVQREKPLPVWGWSKPGEAVTVKLAGRTATAVAAADGRWQVAFAPMRAGGPHELIATTAGGAQLVCKDVLVGEVWLLSGQSNMGGPLLSSIGGVEAATMANRPEVRQTTVFEGRVEVDGARRVLPMHWTKAVSDGDAAKLKNWNSIAFAFGSQVSEQLGVPVGLIINNRGGTVISTWMSRDAQRQDPTLQPVLAAYENTKRDYLDELPMLDKAARQIEKWKKTGRQGEPLAGIGPEPLRNAPALNYESLVQPLASMAIRGVLWYQGESDSREAEAYQTRFKSFIQDWRATWRDDSLPILFAQIATSNGQPHQGPPGDSPQGELREAQAMALSLPHTAMIVTMDLPRPSDDVHFLDKLSVGRRFALSALGTVYGQKITSSGPIYRGMRIEGSSIRLAFDHAAGLHAKGEKLGGFALAGADQKWIWADAKIDGATVIVSSPQIPQPVAVRYGWTATPCGANLYNAADLPSPCFRTDDWPLTTAGRIGVTKN